MTRFLANILFLVFIGVLAGHAASPDAVARSLPVQPSFDVAAMPAPAAPFDTTEITAVETVGAARNE